MSDSDTFKVRIAIWNTMQKYSNDLGKAASEIIKYILTAGPDAGDTGSNWVVIIGKEQGWKLTHNKPWYLNFQNFSNEIDITLRSAAL